jgi:hypothetical protein
MRTSRDSGGLEFCRNSCQVPLAKNGGMGLNSSEFFEISSGRNRPRLIGFFTGKRRVEMRSVGIGLICLILVMFIGFFADTGAQEEGDMCVPMGDIELAPPESVDSLRGEVMFPHSLHFANDCKSCHHKWGGQGTIQGCMTSGCHDVDVSPEKGKDPRYYKSAYHGQCIGCHKQIKQRNEQLERSGKILTEKLSPEGPTGCVQCHG